MMEGRKEGRRKKERKKQSYKLMKNNCVHLTLLFNIISFLVNTLYTVVDINYILLRLKKNQAGDISTLEGTSLKLVDRFTYLGSSVSSTEKDIGTRLTKAWTAIDKLSIIWKSDLTDKMKRSFFQAAVVSILLYGCTTWTLTKRLEKKLDSNYTRML